MTFITNYWDDPKFLKKAGKTNVVSVENGVCTIGNNGVFWTMPLPHGRYRVVIESNGLGSGAISRPTGAQLVWLNSQVDNPRQTAEVETVDDTIALNLWNRNGSTATISGS